MRLTHLNGQFWLGRQVGSAVFARWGTRDKTRQQTTTFKTPATAARELRALVKKLEGVGFVRDCDESLLTALAANPRDETALAVHADTLLAAGDARGELAALTMRRREADLARFLKANAAQLFGPARDDAEQGFIDELTWSPGFLYGAEVHEFLQNDQVQAMPEVVARLIEAPVAALLRDLTLHQSSSPWSDSIRVLLTDAPNLEVLSALRLRSDDPEPDVGDLSLLWPSVRALRELELAGNTEQLGSLALPQLSRLTRRAGPCSSREFAAWRACELPRLERLDWGLQSGEPEADDHALLVLHLQRTSLRHLALRHLTLTERFVDALLESPALTTLETLDLGDCLVEDEEVAELLNDSEEELKHLKGLSTPFRPPDDDFGDADVDDDLRQGEPVLEGWKNLVDEAWPAT